MVLPLPSLQLIVAVFILSSIIAYFKDRPTLKCGSCVPPYCDEYSVESVNCTELCLTEKLGEEVISQRCGSWQEINSPLRYATSFFGVSVESHEFVNGRELCFCNTKDYCRCELDSYMSKVESWGSTALSSVPWRRIFDWLEIFIRLEYIVSKFKKESKMKDPVSKAQYKMKKAMSMVERKIEKARSKFEAKIEKLEYKMEKARKKFLRRLF